MVSKMKYIFLFVIILYADTYSQDYLIPPRNIFSYYHSEELPYYMVFNKLMLNKKRYLLYRGDALEIVHLSGRPSEWVVMIYDNSPENKTYYDLICNVSDSSGNVTRSYDYPKKRIDFLNKCKIKTFTKKLSLSEGRIILEAYKKMIYDTKQIKRIIAIGEADDEYYNFNEQYAMQNPFAEGEKCGLLYNTSKYLMQYSTCEKKNEQYFMTKIIDNCTKILNSSSEERVNENEKAQALDFKELAYIGIIAVLSIILLMVSTIKKKALK